MRLPDGRVLRCIWCVDYYETTAPWLAQQAAREYFIRAKLSRNFEKLSPPELEADYVVMYKNSFGAPTVIIQNNCIVVQAMFLNTSEYKFNTDDCVKILWDSIK